MINILLCGGSGTRLWPISRKSYPKQFCRLLGDKSLFMDTVARNNSTCNKQIIITSADNFFMAVNQIEEMEEDCDAFEYILEPKGRNTAPAVALGCFYAKPDDIIFVSPADHIITNTDAYITAAKLAEKAAGEGFLVTFGIKPLSPETGYGYIEAESSGNVIRKTISFKEKPDKKTAEEYIASGNYFWNSGMFCFKVGVFLDELKKYCPEIYKKSYEAYKNAMTEDGVHNIDLDDMMSIPSDSIDYAVMEKSSLVKVIPVDLGWNDVGSYDALDKEFAKDDNGNSGMDNNISVDSSNITAISEKVVATLGVSDLFIIDTKDALLVAKKGTTQKIKDIVPLLEKAEKKDKKYTDLTILHTTAHRPWGSYTVLESGDRYKMKRIVVKPGKRLSLQKHYHRSEHWVVVSGSAVVTRGDEEIFLKTNESIYIPMGIIHRLENQGKIDLVVLEIQVGEYLAEDDIVRVQDDFKRG
ncbi:MAG: mannose-1-phosphate guanylyltransferase/mannose-6-phosphate isomerase [Deferribacterales bacterium]